MSAGQIHDLGYKRYVGTRRSVDTRWIVVMRHQLATAWKTWWRFKVWLVAAAMATAVAAGFLYLTSGRLFRMLGSLSGEAVRFADGILPLSTLWYCKIGFLISLTIGSTVVAGDLQSGAFTFYFARSARPRDYVLGKLAGLGALVALIMLAGPVILAGARIGLSDLDQVVAMLPILPKALAIGVLGTLIYAAIPLGFSAVMSSRSYAMALWAAYYIVVSNIVVLVSTATSPALGALDLPSSLQAVALYLFELRASGRRTLEIPPELALASILGHAAIAIALVFWRVRNAQRTGVGGAS